MKRQLVTPQNHPEDKKPFKRGLLESYQIRTVFGVTLLNSRSRVLVREGEDFYRVPVTELKCEQEVLFAKEGLSNISVFQINDALMNSQRYAATMPILFKSLCDGSRTPLFAYSLLEGMINHPEEWPINIQTSLSFKPGEPIQLDNAQGERAAKHIHGLLKAQDIIVSHPHIRRNWLGGNVIAPKNYQLVIPHLLPLAQNLATLLSEDFHKAYGLYIRIRINVMRSISLVLRGTAEGLERPKNGAE